MKKFLLLAVTLVLLASACATTNPRLVTASPAAISTSLPPASTASPAPDAGFPIQSWSQLPADRSLLVYPGAAGDPGLYAADPVDGIAYAYNLPIVARFATPYLAGLSPDARYFVYFEGGTIESPYGEPLLRADRPDLVLRVLELATGEVIFSAPLLSRSYPADLSQIAERIKDDWNFTNFNYSFEDVIAATQALMLERIRNVAWSPDGSLLAYPAQNPGPSTDLYFFSPARGESWRVMDEPDHVLRAVWSSDSSALVLVTSTYDRMAREDTTYLLDRDGVVRTQFTSQIRYFHHWHDPGHALVYGGTDAGDEFEPQVISAADGSTRLLWDGSFGTIAFSPDLSTFLIGSNMPSAPQPPGKGLFLVQSGILQPALSGEWGWSVEYWGSERFAFAASSSRPGTFGVTPAGEMAALDPGYFRLAASPDGRLLAGYKRLYPNSPPGTIPGLRIFAGDGQTLHAVDGPEIFCVAWNPDSSVLAYQAADGVHVWTASDGVDHWVAAGPGTEECAIGWRYSAP